MAPTRRAVLGMTAVSIGLAGCAGASDSPGGAGDDAPETTEAGGTTVEATTTGATMSEGTTTTDGSGMASASVAVADHPELGEILVDGDGMTLYMFDSDEQGSDSSTCTGGCLDAWPPLATDGTPEAGDGVTAELTTFDRGDGTTQVAANGWPLYYWQGDSSPGDATGQGVNDVWWVLRPDGTPVRPGSGGQAAVEVAVHPDYGDILVDSEGTTLYMFENDEQSDGSSTCTGGCAEAWPPLTVDEDPSTGDGVSAELTTFQRSDGSTQVAANGWPLYYWQNDEEPGDATGQGVNDVWWVLDPAGEPQRGGTTTTVSNADDGY